MQTMLRVLVAVLVGLVLAPCGAEAKSLPTAPSVTPTTVGDPMPPPGAKQRRAINAELKRVCEADFGVYPGKTGNWLRVVFVATNPKQGCGLTGLRAGQLTDDVGKWTITGWMFAWDRSSNRKWEAKACTLDIPVDYVRGVYNFTVPTAYSCSVEPAKPAAGVITLIDEARKGEKRL